MELYLLGECRDLLWISQSFLVDLMVVNISDIDIVNSWNCSLSLLCCDDFEDYCVHSGQ